MAPQDLALVRGMADTRAALRRWRAPELTWLFLPLAAWLVASRRGEWSALLAATFVTVALAVPVIVASAVVETYVTPHVIRAAIGL